jgi:4-diphosphocytidyl-2-C-methyl-D-erythritol kinase
VTRVVRVAAQAKVNLELRVGPAAPSGYHWIFTIFQRLDLADEIVIRVGRRERSVDVAGEFVSKDLGPAEENLAFRAATAFADRAMWPSGFSIELTKRIPIGGGLGGGSADAGAVLRGLNAVAPNQLDSRDLQEIARSLGADIPFLTSEHVLACGSGRGDHLFPLSALPPRNVVLAVPRFGVNTGDAYGWLDRDGGGTLEGPSSREMADAIGEVPGSSTWGGMAARSHNDFEPVVERRHPQLRTLRERLAKSGARIARLSGSGSTVFGVFDGRPPSATELALDALVIPTRTSSKVVQVEVLE